MPLPRTTCPVAPGGIFEEAVAISSLFLEPATRVAQTVRTGVTGPPLVDATWSSGSGMVGVAYPTGGMSGDALAAGPLTTRPVALLVNRSTASASEVLAGECGRGMQGWVTFGTLAQMPGFARWWGGC